MATRSFRTPAFVLLLGLCSVGCGAEVAEQVESPDAIAETRSAARTVDVAEPEPLVPVLEDDVDPMGVITAAVLLHTGGDVDAALATGSFTRADLDAARRGLADGSLDHLFD